jgi:chemotaxis protein methyltransferase CheR
MSVSTRSFDFVRQLVHERSAVVLDNAQSYLVETRLLPLVRTVGASSVDALVELLRTSAYGSLHSQVIEAMVTTETSFFRDFQPFEALRTRMLPEIVQRNAAERQISMWCSACSSGQEAYSTAMLLAEAAPQLAGWNVQVHASDLSTVMLERAERGVYTQAEVNRGLPATYLVKYFDKNGAEWCVKDALRRLVRFQRINLNGAWPLLPRMDVVLMRNVLIYFDVATRHRILDKTRRLLKEGGFLLVGTAETMLGFETGFERLRDDRVVYFRRKD